MRRPEVLAIYESGRSGETKASEKFVENISKEFLTEKHVSRTFEKSSLFYLAKWNIKNIIDTYLIINSKKPSKWVYSTTYLGCFTAALLKKKFNYKICFHYHGSRIPDKPRHILSLYRAVLQNIKRKVITSMHYYAFNNSDLIITPSHFTKKWLLRDFKMLNHKRVEVLYNGVDLKEFKKMSQYSKKEIKAKLKVNSTDRIITYVGILHKRKNLERLFDAFSAINRKSITIKLLIAYTKPTDSESENMLKVLKSRATENIYFVEGYSPINEIYNISDLVVLPSHLEHFPLVTLEAFAAKALFTSTRSGDLTSIMKSIDGRLLIKSDKPGDLSKHMQKLLNLSSLEKEKILEKEYRYAKNNTWEKTSKKLVKFLSN